MPIPLSTKSCYFNWPAGTLLEKIPLRFSPNRTAPPLTPGEQEIAVVLSCHATTVGGYVTVLIVESQKPGRKYFKTTLDVDGARTWTPMQNNNQLK